VTLASSRAARLLVTGERGAGKTLFCRALVEAVRALPVPPEVAGVVSPRVYEAGEQVAIDVEDLRSGGRRRLAWLRGADEPALSQATKLWRFDPEALAWGNEVLRSATPCALLVIDELGPLEFEEARGWLAGLVAVDSGAFTVAAVVVRPRLLPEARRRWPAAEVIQIEGVAGTSATAGRLARRWFAPRGLR
jgi:nucleoside-triphosphatase THEP1